MVLPNKQKSFFINAFWLIAGSGVSKVLAFVASLIIARELEADYYGEYIWLKQNIMSMAVFASFGLGYTSTKYIASWVNHHNNSAVLYRIGFIRKFARALVVTLILALLSLYWIKSDITPFDISGFTIALSVILIIVRCEYIVDNGIISGLGKFQEISKIELVNGSVLFVLSMLVFLVKSVPLMLGVFLVATMISVLQQKTIIAQSFRVLDEGLSDEKHERKILRKTFITSLPLGFIEIGYALSQLILFTTLARYGGSQMVAIYGIGLQWYNLALFVPFALRRMILHRLSEGQNESRTIYGLLFSHLILGLIPILIYVVLQDFVLELYGRSYGSLGNVLELMLISALLSSISGVIAQNMIATDRTVHLLLWRAVRDFGMLITVFIFGKELTIFDVCKLFLLFQGIFLAGLCLRKG